MLTAAESAAAQDFHDMWQRSHDPAIPMFAGWFGKEWAERLASEVLFPEDKAKEELKAWEAQQREGWMIDDVCFAPSLARCRSPF